MRYSTAVRVGCLSAVIAALACPARAWADAPSPPTDPAAAAAAAKPASATATPEELRRLAERLGDANPTVRDEAAAALRGAGRAAEPALRELGESGDPESARRARRLLRELRGPEPAEPPAHEWPELAAFREAGREAKLELVQQFGTAGGYRAALLARLWSAEPEGELRAAMFRAMLQSPAGSATALVAQGNAPAAERLLEAALAEHNVEAAAPYAALALIRGKLDEAIAEWSARASRAAAAAADAEGAEGAAEEPGEAEDATVGAVLAHLYRAARDPRAALPHARRAGDPALVEQTLVDAGDWAALAEAVRGRPEPVEAAQQLGMLAAALHLVGDDDGFNEVARRMEKLADVHSAEDVARVLLLAGRPDDAVRLLGEHDRWVLQFQLLAALDRFDEALALLDETEDSRIELALSLRVVAAEQFYALGENKRAAELLGRVARENQDLASPRIYEALGAAARRMGAREKAWSHFLEAVRLQGGREGASTFTARQAFKDEKDEIDGGELWELLGERLPEESLAQRVARARAVADGTMPAQELKDLAGSGEGDGVLRAHAAHLFRAAGERIRAAGDEAGAVNYLETVAASAPAPEHAAELYQRVGDWAAARQDWRAAATSYGRAWSADPTRPVPLYLRALALRRAGWNARAGELFNRTHALPLADGASRLDAMQALHDRGMYAEVAREVAVVTRTTNPTALPADFAYRLGAELAVRAGDPLAAAASLERPMLNLMGPFLGLYSFPDESGFVRLPHTLRRNRARGLLARGDVAAAEREIAACRAMLPGDVMLPNDVVPEFERLGNKARADELYAEAMAAQEAVLARYPDSAAHHNSLAWLAVICGRDADKAMAHARRAVALRPDNASVIDTLAEAQFRRGDIDEAIKNMTRCAQLEPDVPRHREQLERFEAAKRGEQRPMPPG